MLSIVSADADSDIVDAIACPHCGAVRDIGLWDLGTNIECAACNEPFGVPKTPGGAALRTPWPAIRYVSESRAVASTGAVRRSFLDCLDYFDSEILFPIVRRLVFLAGVSLWIVGEAFIVWIFFAIYGNAGPVLVLIMPLLFVVISAIYTLLYCVVCYSLYVLLSSFIRAVELWAEHGIRRAGQD